MKAEQKRNLLIGLGILLALYVATVVYREVAGTADYTSVEEIKKAKAENVDAVIGMQKKKILTNRNGSTVWFTIGVEDFCDFGDFDYMSADMNELGVSSLLLTVEPLLGVTEETKTKRVKIKRSDITKGYEVNFTFPYTKTKQHFGLFLCSDKAGTKSCQQKPVADYSGKEIKSDDKDSVFFFSYFSNQKGEIEILDNVIGSYAIQQVRDYLQGQSDLSEEQRKRIFLTILRLNRSTKLRTGSVDLSGERIGLKLTRMKHNIKSCDNIKRDVISAGANGKVYITDKDGETVEAPPLEESDAEEDEN